MEKAVYGDLNDLLDKKKLNDEDLIRTLFLDILNGLEYLHEQGIAHMDIKPENIVLGGDFNLKLIDFDLSFEEGDTALLGNGTKHYRAPEVKNKTCENPDLGDIYSAGVILFCMKSGGYRPFLEDEKIAGIDFEDLLENNNKFFW
mmetsp:Transcript_40444/g.35897  ORF Transcript_40444/g.35897 Transcript_40444/m.35897 type:complete len:145 (+) Transcript_40444:423-857(+)|eukprot:CAMPEP_0114584388 /NCGR_PEP_ID=MMETSP0125-20121206/8085_1 /TAXON_ID=485358 ORGANISM="Aristerostoma sp., Strain ATCC 50986" /NCGR_SAMPLE_ID=MMETSP0125 /ASSEMBLY_ACC=CAM_ASM_000245 /LENGTH=144 /DNA_ID=CAMNT_0001778723 /DNA_START=404 /DNA_END=835 /DNA_ORIENTATION=-